MLFLGEVPRMLADIRQALAQADAPTLQRTAHTLKSSLALFGAPGAAAAARALEQIGREGDLSRGASARTALEAALRRLTPEIAALAEEGRGPGGGPTS